EGIRVSCVAGRSDRLERLLELRFIASVQHDSGARGGEPVRNGVSDTLAGAGDESAAPLQAEAIEAHGRSSGFHRSAVSIDRTILGRNGLRISHTCSSADAALQWG